MKPVVRSVKSRSRSSFGRLKTPPPSLLLPWSSENSSSTSRCRNSIIVLFNVMIVTEGEEGVFELDNHGGILSVVVIGLHKVDVFTQG